MNSNNQERKTLSAIRQEHIESNSTGSYIEKNRNTPKTYSKSEIRRMESTEGFVKMVEHTYGKSKEMPKEATKISFDRVIEEDNFASLQPDEESTYIYTPGDENSENIRVRILEDKEASKSLPNNQKIFKVVYDKNLDKLSNPDPERVANQLTKDSLLTSYIEAHNGEIITDIESFYNTVISDEAKNSISRKNIFSNISYRNYLFEKQFDNSGVNMFGMTKEDLDEDKPFNTTIKYLSGMFTGNLLVNGFSKERLQYYKFTYNEDGSISNYEKIGDTKERKFTNTNNINRYLIGTDNSIKKEFNDDVNVTNRLVRLLSFNNNIYPSYSNVVDQFGFSLDCDGVNESQLKNILKAIDLGILLKPTVITNSGNGLHLHYALDKPISIGKGMYGVQADYRKNKSNIIYLSQCVLSTLYYLILIPDVLVRREESVKTLNVLQGFRSPGSTSKSLLSVKAFSFNKIHTLDEIREWSLKTIKRFSNIAKKLNTEYNGNLEEAYFNEAFDGMPKDKTDLRLCIEDAINSGLINPCFIKGNLKKEKVIEQASILLSNRRMKILKFNSYSFIKDSINNISLKDRNYIIPYNVINHPRIIAENNKRLEQGNASFQAFKEKYPDLFNKPIMEYEKPKRTLLQEMRIAEVLKLYVDAQLKYHSIKIGGRYRAFTAFAKILKKMNYTRDEAVAIMWQAVQDGGYNDGIEEGRHFKREELLRMTREYHLPDYDIYSEEILRSHFSEEAWNEFGYDYPITSHEKRAEREKLIRSSEEYQAKLLAEKETRLQATIDKRIARSEEFGEHLATVSRDTIISMVNSSKKASIKNLAKYTLGHYDIDRAIDKCIVLSPILRVNKYSDLKIKRGNNKFLSERTLRKYFINDTEFNRNKAAVITESLFYIYEKLEIHEYSKPEQQLLINKILYKLLNNGKTIEFLNEDGNYRLRTEFIDELTIQLSKAGFVYSSKITKNAEITKFFFRALDTSVSSCERTFSSAYISNIKELYNKYEEIKDIDKFKEYVKNEFSPKFIELKSNYWSHNTSIIYITKMIKKIHKQVGVLQESLYLDKLSILGCSKYSNEQKETLIKLIELLEDAREYSTNKSWVNRMYMYAAKDYGYDHSETKVEFVERAVKEKLIELSKNNELTEEEKNSIANKLKNRLFIKNRLNNGFIYDVITEDSNLKDDLLFKKELTELIKNTKDNERIAPVLAYAQNRCKAFDISNFNDKFGQKLWLKPKAFNEEASNVIGSIDSNNYLQSNLILNSFIFTSTAPYIKNFNRIWSKNKKTFMGEDLYNKYTSIVKRLGSDNRDYAYLQAVTKYDVMDSIGINDREDFEIWNELSPQDVIADKIKDFRESYKFKEAIIQEFISIGVPEEVIDLIMDTVKPSFDNFSNELIKLHQAVTKLLNLDYENTDYEVIRAYRNNYLLALADLNRRAYGTLSPDDSGSPPD